MTVTLMLLILAAATIVNVALNFRGYAFDAAEEKAKITASVVRDGLTAHMINGIMDKRLDFLRNVSNKHSVEDLWIVRGSAVTQQFGDGFKNEHTRDAIDEKVLQTAQTVREIQETSQTASIRVTIPYIASAYGTPNCLQCHTNVKEGDVLGAISMRFDIGDVRNIGAMTILKIFAINLVFIIIALYVINRYTRPYIDLFDQLKHSILKAHTGDFNSRLERNIPKEAQDVVESYNSLFDKMEDTFGEVKNSLATFVTKMDCNKSDPLYEANMIIHELADVYRFKKTIELDRDKASIYNRLVHLLEMKFKVKNFAFYEVNHLQKQRKLIYITGKDEKSFCTQLSENNAGECRAFRTGTDIFSSDFPNLCEQCTNKSINYICIPYQINEKSSLVISMSTYDMGEYNRINENVTIIKNYLEAAKPVIESKILMEILKDTSVKDGLTGLYNRRFLDEFIEKLSAQNGRNRVDYAILMVDIDYFKMVNDTFGHDVGDLVIKRLAEVLTENIRSSDLAIRFGGEEFLVMLHNPTEEGAMDVAQKIRTSFEAVSFQVESESIKKTVSVGLSLFPKDADSVWKVIKFADTALYKAKNSGRNRVARFKPQDFEGENF